MPDLKDTLTRALRATPFAYGALLVLARALPVVTIIVASRLLPADEFGSLAVLITAITVASLIADAGTDNAAGWIASHADTQEQADRTLGALVYTRVAVAGLATAALTVPQLGFLAGNAANHVGILVVAVLGNCLASLNAARRIRMRVVGGGEPRAILLEKLCLSVAFGAWLALAPATELSVVWGYVLANLLAPIVASPLLPWVNMRSSAAAIGALLGRAAPFILTTLCSALTWRAATFLLAESDQLDQAGYLTLAYYPIQVIATVPAVSAPLLLIKGRSAQLSMRMSLFSALGVGVLIAGVCLGLSLLPEMLGMGGHLNGDAVLAFQVMLLAVPLVWINPILISHLRLKMDAWRPTLAPLVSAVAALALALAVVPSKGAPGAAAVIACAELITCVGLLILLSIQRREARAQ